MLNQNEKNSDSVAIAEELLLSEMNGRPEEMKDKLKKVISLHLGSNFDDFSPSLIPFVLLKFITFHQLQAFMKAATSLIFFKERAAKRIFDRLLRQTTAVVSLNKISQLKERCNNVIYPTVDSYKDDFYLIEINRVKNQMLPRKPRKIKKKWNMRVSRHCHNF